MATGDQNDIFSRLQTALPSSWFGALPTVLNALLQGYAWAGSFVYALYAYAVSQTRILTATDNWLDVIAWDYFGSAVVRAANQSDAAFKSRILVNLIRERATRSGVVAVLVNLTNRTPDIFEPQRPLDTGAYGVAELLAYGMAGGYGSMLLPYQAFVKAYRPVGVGLPVVACYGLSAGGGAGGYGGGAIEYGSMAFILGNVTDDDIYAAIDSVIPFGTVAWTNIGS